MALRVGRGSAPPSNSRTSVPMCRGRSRPLRLPRGAVERFVRKLEKKHPRLHFCYEAGPTGHRLYRQMVELGQRC